MVRILSPYTGAVLLAALAGSAGSAQDRPLGPFPFHEVHGPALGPDARGPFHHINMVAFTRDGTRMAAGAGANVFVWDTADGKELVRMQLPARQLYHWLAFSDDGKELVWCGREDSKVRVWDVKTGRQVREFDQPHGRAGRGFSSYFLAFSHDGRRMAFHGPGFFEGIDVLDVASGKVTLHIADQKDCRGCDFSPDGKLLAAHSGTGGVRLWDARTGKLVRELRAEDTQGGGAYKFATFSPDGRRLATGGHTNSNLDVWSVRTDKLVCSVPSKDYFYSVGFSPDGQSLVCVESGGEPYLYNLVAEKRIYRFNPPERLAHFVTFTPDGRRVAIIAESGSGGAKGEANVRRQSIYLYDVPPTALNPPAAQVDDAALEKLWDELSTGNDLRLRRVRQALRAAPGPAVGLFRRRLSAVTKEEQAKADLYVAQLDDPVPARRDRAMKELRRLFHRFAPLLEARKEAAGPGEVRNRLTFLVGEMEAGPLPASVVRERRALALLEQMATPEARRLLRELAAGAPQARLTGEARAALGRAGKGRAGTDP